MTLYNLIVFCMLVLQMVCTLALVIPLPYVPADTLHCDVRADVATSTSSRNKVRGSLLRFIATSELVAKLQYGLKILCVHDCVQIRVARVLTRRHVLPASSLSLSSSSMRRSI